MESVEDHVDVACVRAEVERGGEVDPVGDARVRFDQPTEVEAFVPGAQGVPLHQAIRLVAGQPGLDQREQDALREEEAVAPLQVCEHPLGEDDEAFDQPGEPVEHVVEREERVRHDDALGRRVRDVALVPESDVLEADLRGGADDAREAADPLRDDRVALVRHRRRALLSLAERLLHLAHLGAGEVADLGREPVERRGDERERGEELGVAVARDDLRRDRLRLETEPLAGDSLQLRIGDRVRPDRARELSEAHAGKRMLEAFPASVELERPAGELESEGGRLRVDAVRPADADRQPVLLGASDDRSLRACDALEEQRAGVPELEGECRVDDVGRCQPVVEPAALLAELRLDGVDEGGQVVAGLALQLGDPLGRGRNGALRESSPPPRAGRRRARPTRRRRRARPRARRRASSRPTTPRPWRDGSSGRSLV